MRTSTAIGVGVLAVGVGVAVVIGVVGPMSADEEAPIVVKNGTLEILVGTGIANQWDWVAETGDNMNPQPSFSHEPANKYRDRSKTHWVKVDMDGGSCEPNRQTAKGALIVITYTYEQGTKTKVATIQRGASGPFKIDYRTKVRPADLTPGTASGGRKALIFGQTGFISTISVPDDNWTCTFKDAQANPRLSVCAAAEKKDCQ